MSGSGGQNAHPGRGATDEMRGATMFMRFGYPPNALGYCGPDDAAEIAAAASGEQTAAGDVEHLARAFAGAWPYLQLIAAVSGSGPLDEHVVEAYWIGNSLLDRVDSLTWGNSLDERFRKRTGSDWDAVAGALAAGGVPNHAFHVFCVYPWVGLLRSGASDRALEVLDRCRVRWGRVVDTVGEQVLVASRPLSWDGRRLYSGAERLESVDPPLDPSLASLAPGDLVAMHWNYVCQPLTTRQVRGLQRNQERHLRIINETGRGIAARIER